jgi:hypothetical protein
MYLNLRMFHMGLDLRGDCMLFMWIRPVAKLKFLVLMFYLFSLREPIPNVPKVLHLKDPVRVSGSYGPT